MTPSPTQAQDSLRDLPQEQFVEALNAKFSTIYQGLLEAENCKSSFGVTFKLTLVKGRAFSDCDLHGAEKWSAQVEGNVKLFEPDPEQRKMEDV